MDTIVLHIQNKRRRKQLARVLRREYEVTTGVTGSEPEGDLLLVDFATYEETGADVVQAFKERHAGIASPVLLLVPSDWMSRLDSPTWERVDDVIEIPVRPAEFKGRVRVLIRWNQASRETRRLAQEVRSLRSPTEDGEGEAHEGPFDAAVGEVRPSALLVVNGSEIVETNDRARTLFGRAEDGLVGRPVASLSPSRQPIDPAVRQSLGDLFRAVDATGACRTLWYFQRSNGELFGAHVTLARGPGRDDDLVHVVVQEADRRDVYESPAGEPSGHEDPPRESAA